MVGVEILARAAWPCLPGDSVRPRALAGVVAAHDAMRAQAGRTADEEDCDPRGSDTVEQGKVRFPPPRLTLACELDSARLMALFADGAGH
jgi:hypothetical protein